MNTKVIEGTDAVDARDTAIGEEIARVLQLKKDRSTGRYNTAWGDKTAMGLARTLRRVFDELEA